MVGTGRIIVAVVVLLRMVGVIYVVVRDVSRVSQFFASLRLLCAINAVIFGTNNLRLRDSIGSMLVVVPLVLKLPVHFFHTFER